MFCVRKKCNSFYLLVYILSFGLLLYIVSRLTWINVCVHQLNSFTDISLENSSSKVFLQLFSALHNFLSIINWKYVHINLPILFSVFYSFYGPSYSKCMKILLQCLFLNPLFSTFSWASTYFRCFQVVIDFFFTVFISSNYFNNTAFLYLWNNQSLKVFPSLFLFLILIFFSILSFSPPFVYS